MAALRDRPSCRPGTSRSTAKRSTAVWAAKLEETKMFNARWQIDAKFGHKQTVLELLKKWEREIGSQVGIADLKFPDHDRFDRCPGSDGRITSSGRKPCPAGGFLRQDRQDRCARQMGQGDGALRRVGHQPLEHLSHRRIGTASAAVFGRQLRRPKLVRWPEKRPSLANPAAAIRAGAP